jgi:hypothetical protein
MFTSPTVILLGAGASYEFGAPLGESLWGQIVNSTVSVRKSYERYAEQHMLRTSQQRIRDHRYSDPKAYAYLSEILSLYDEPAALDAITLVKDSSNQFGTNLHGVIARVAERVTQTNFHASVDDYLRDNPTLLRPLRVLIASIIFNGLYEKDDERNHQWNLRGLADTKRFSSPHDSKVMVDNWLHSFVGACRPMLIGATKITPVTVVSFNYDRLMETVLARYWSRAERQFPSFEKCFEFIYPYGCFGEFPELVHEPGDWLREQAKGIGLADGQQSHEQARIRCAVSEARQIFSIGFSFTAANIKLLGLTPAHGAKLFVQNYDDKDTRLTRTLQRFPKAQSDPSPIAKLVRDGFFEQLGRSRAYTIKGSAEQ